MADFNFITLPELRQCLETDYTELQTCLRAKAWKSVHVLAGSIVEAVLIDSLEAIGCNPQKALNEMMLGDLIPLAKANGLLQDETIDLSTVIRKYRNLIHPGRIVRLEKQVDESGAIIATQVVELVIREVAKKRLKHYGRTAEDLLQKLQSGTTALPLVKHLVSETSDREILRLLKDILPAAYIQWMERESTSPSDLEHLRNCFRAVFDATSDTCRKAVTERFYSVCRNEPEWKALIYEEAFFQCHDLAYLTNDEVDFIKAHLLGRVNPQSMKDMKTTLSGIGKHLTPPETGRFFWSLYNPLDETVAFDEDLHFLKTEYRDMREECRNEILSACSFTTQQFVEDMNKWEKACFGAKALPPVVFRDDLPF